MFSRIISNADLACDGLYTTSHLTPKNSSSLKENASNLALILFTHVFLSSFFFQTAFFFFLPVTRLDRTTGRVSARKQRPQRDYRGETAVGRFQFVTESRSLQINPIPLPTPLQLDPVTWSRVTPMTSTGEGGPSTSLTSVTLASRSCRSATIILLVETKRINATRSRKTLTFCRKIELSRRRELVGIVFPRSQSNRQSTSLRDWKIVRKQMCFPSLSLFLF